ncbi:hypothetical protein [Reichenbachiella ulvae]|uniref:Lumazine-binding n=1 Tax=Reichenbachiella ulvae TaxID=2980104 RepID=A0ABT3CWG3_9BACT|nr:hypothetical protein [Reichenbachiella ulvae]MCV9387937.1 hypothetical protein [Reichenbachiella ulvae]
MRYFQIIFCIGISLFLFQCESEKTEQEKISPEAKEVRQVVLDVFQAMYDNDSLAVKKCFQPGAKLYTIFERNDSTHFREGELSQFVTAVGSPHEVEWIERSWDYQVSIDQGFAQVWCQYAFFAGERFSHCGVDAFHLVNTPTGWKIFSLADTRRKEDCIFPTGEFFEPQ